MCKKSSPHGTSSCQSQSQKTRRAHMASSDNHDMGASRDHAPPRQIQDVSVGEPEEHQGDEIGPSEGQNPDDSPETPVPPQATPNTAHASRQLLGGPIHSSRSLSERFPGRPPWDFPGYPASQRPGGQPYPREPSLAPPTVIIGAPLGCNLSAVEAADALVRQWEWIREQHLGQSEPEAIGEIDARLARARADRAELDTVANRADVRDSLYVRLIFRPPREGSWLTSDVPKGRHGALPTESRFRPARYPPKGPRRIPVRGRESKHHCRHELLPRWDHHAVELLRPLLRGPFRRLRPLVRIIHRRPQRTTRAIRREARPRMVVVRAPAGTRRGRVGGRETGR